MLGQARLAQRLRKYTTGTFAGIFSQQSNIDINRVGVLGFSWGGVMSLASATQNVATALGGNLRFKAHAANYPICYAYNNPAIPNSGFGTPGGYPLTGAPILVQVGSQDDYDRANASGDGSARCAALKASLPAGEQALMDVVRQYVDAHGFAELARRYALNLANARFLWRNRLGAEAVTVEIARLEQGQAAQTWTFDALALDTRSFNTPVPDNVAELARHNNLPRLVLVDLLRGRLRGHRGQRRRRLGHARAPGTAVGHQARPSGSPAR